MLSVKIYLAPKWLGLLDEYWLADSQIYQQAIKMYTFEHVFNRIFVVSGDGCVTDIYNDSSQSKKGRTTYRACIVWGLILAGVYLIIYWLCSIFGTH